LPGAIPRQHDLVSFLRKDRSPFRYPGQSYDSEQALLDAWHQSQAEYAMVDLVLANMFSMPQYLLEKDAAEQVLPA
jgi:hypothetical protein